MGAQNKAVSGQSWVIQNHKKDTLLLLFHRIRLQAAALLLG